MFVTDTIQTAFQVAGILMALAGTGYVIALCIGKLSEWVKQAKAQDAANAEREYNERVVQAKIDASQEFHKRNK